MSRVNSGLASIAPSTASLVPPTVTAFEVAALKAGKPGVHINGRSHFDMAYVSFTPPGGPPSCSDNEDK
jgi:hypothetical protein